MEKKDLIKKLGELSDDILIDIFKKSNGSRDEYTIDRKPNGSIFIRWSNDNGFRETASGTHSIFSIKTEQIDLNYIPHLIRQKIESKTKLTMKCTYPDCNCPESGCQGFGELKKTEKQDCQHKELMKNGDSYYCIKCRLPYFLKSQNPQSNEP